MIENEVTLIVEPPFGLYTLLVDHEIVVLDLLFMIFEPDPTTDNFSSIWLPDLSIKSSLDNCLIHTPNSKVQFLRRI